MGLFGKVKAALLGGGRHRVSGDRSVAPGPAQSREQPASGEAAQAAGESGARLRRHTVLPGETLPGIAERHGVDGSAMADLNGIEDPELIYPGQVFKVPHA